MFAGRWWSSYDVDTTHLIAGEFFRFNEAVFVATRPQVHSLHIVDIFKRKTKVYDQTSSCIIHLQWWSFEKNVWCCIHWHYHVYSGCYPRILRQCSSWILDGVCIHYTLFSVGSAIVAKHRLWQIMAVSKEDQNQMVEEGYIVVVYTFCTVNINQHKHTRINRCLTDIWTPRWCFIYILAGHVRSIKIF